MKMPNILKGFNLFVDGENQYGVVVDVTRPKISRKTEDYTPGGGLGEMTVIHGIEKLEIELTSKGYDAELFKSMSHQISGNLLRYQGALHKEDETGAGELVGEARGRIIEADPGEDKAGEGGEHKFKYALTYWKETLDGETIAEIDILNNKFIIGGRDVRAGIRKALGLI